MNGIIYCRVSSKEQVEGTSLDSQELACREYATRNGISVLKVFVERGESAKFADRTELLELMEFCACKQNAVQALLVWKVDRLARNVGDHFNIKANLLKHGIKVISVTEPIDTKPEGKLLETILAGFAQFDNDLRAARTVQGMRKKIQEGIFPWKPPFGYKTINQPGNKKTEPDQPDQPMFGLLQRMWEEFATGAYTKAEILRLATSWGLRTRTGIPLVKQSLDNIFKDRFYAGIIIDPWSGEEHVGRHVALVTPEVFDRVQEIIARRNHSVRHTHVHEDFPLRLFARCGGCRHYLTGSASRGRSKHYSYYHCFNRDCPEATYSRSQVVHAEFNGFLRSIAPTRKDIDWLAEQVVIAGRQRTESKRRLREKSTAELRRLDQQHQQLINMRTQSLISDDEFLAQRSILNTRRLSLQTQSPTVLLNAGDISRKIDQICEPLLNLADTWTEVPAVLKQRFQRLILPAGFVAGRIGTADMSCLFSVFQRSRHAESNLVPHTGQFWNQLVDELKSFASVLHEGLGWKSAP